MRKGDNNRLFIRVHGLDATKKQLIKTVSGLLLGSICGLMIHEFLDATTFSMINDEVITEKRRKAPDFSRGDVSRKNFFQNKNSSSTVKKILVWR